MRVLSSDALRAMFNQETDEVFLVLLTISHEDLVAPIRVTTDNVNTISRGETFVAYPFEMNLPDDDEAAPPTATITIDNVDREICNTLRRLSSPASFVIETVRAADPDTVEAQWLDFIMRNIQGDASQITGELSLEDVASEPFPYIEFTPSRFRGLFA